MMMARQPPLLSKAVRQLLGLGCSRKSSLGASGEACYQKVGGIQAVVGGNEKISYPTKIAASSSFGSGFPISQK